MVGANSGQAETLRRLRHGGDQHVRVEHIHINEGAQAVIGSVRAPDRRHEATKEMPSQDQGRCSVIAALPFRVPRQSLITDDGSYHTVFQVVANDKIF